MLQVDRPVRGVLVMFLSRTKGRIGWSLASLFYLKKDGEVEVPGRHDQMQDLWTSKFIFLENGTLILE